MLPDDVEPMNEHDAAVFASAGPADPPAAAVRAERLRRLDALMTAAAWGSARAHGELMHRILEAFEALAAQAARHGAAGDRADRLAMHLAIRLSCPRAGKQQIWEMVDSVFPPPERMVAHVA